MIDKEEVNAGLRKSKEQGHTVGCMVSLPSGGSAIVTEETTDLLLIGIAADISNGRIAAIGTAPVPIDRLIHLTK